MNKRYSVTADARAYHPGASPSPLAHFGVTDRDGLNVFGKPGLITAGLTKAEAEEYAEKMNTKAELAKLYESRPCE